MPPSPMPNPQTKRSWFWPVALVVTLLVGVAIGYFARQPQVNTLTAQLDSQQTQQPKSENVNEKRARDTQRQIDMNALATQLEVYYNHAGSYPTLKELHDDDWVSAHLKGISLEALRTPVRDSNSMTDTSTPDATQYGYKTYDGEVYCVTSPCPGSGPNQKFELYWYKEDTSTVQTKKSLN